jgi:hypothetical protein
MICGIALLISLILLTDRSFVDLLLGRFSDPRASGGSQLDISAPNKKSAALGQ